MTAGRMVVTGGAGLIGSAIVWALNRRGIDDIVVVDRLDATEKWKNLVPLRFSDYLDADRFAECIERTPSAFGKISTVFHLGACSSTVECDVGFLMRNNYEYSKTIASWGTAIGAHVVYASSAATYGALENELSDRMPLEQLRPLNAYAFSKHCFDLHAARGGLLGRICGIKYFNVFGPNEGHKGEMRSMVHKAYEQIRRDGTVRLFKSYRPEYADGEQCRDFLYVKDAAEMTLFLADHRATGIVNVGSGRASTWLELVTPVFQALDLPVRIEFIPMPDDLRSKYQYCTRASLETLRSLGYDRPITPLDDAVRDYVRNYLVPDKRLDPADAPSPEPLAFRSTP
jgi:ADP-L-glycero-D-manno-heptose 6-epimerase